MRTPRSLLKLVELGGDIYAIGGVDAGFNPLDTVERYDPGRDAWEAVAPMGAAAPTQGLPSWATSLSLSAAGPAFHWTPARCTTGRRIAGSCLNRCLNPAGLH
jgi:hypothetical protein